MIDIIIPAYNAFETIGKTLNSIAKQVNRNSLNVYIINDGSEKSYDYIINNYISLVNITEIKIANSGPGFARQVGLNSSNNEFIVFMDADDTLPSDDALLNLISIISEADLAQGYFLEKTETDSRVLEPQYCYLHGKMYRRSIIDKNNITFDTTRRYDGDIYEDCSFNILYTLCCNKIATTSEVVYVYEYNPNSITKLNKDVSKHLKNYIDAMTWLAKEIIKRDIKKEHDIAWNFCMICFHSYFNYLLSEEKSSFVFTEMAQIKKMYKKYIDKLSYEEQLSIYKLFDYPVIPSISFYDFMNRILDE